MPPGYSLGVSGLRLPRQLFDRCLRGGSSAVLHHRTLSPCHCRIPVVSLILGLIQEQALNLRIAFIAAATAAIICTLTPWDTADAAAGLKAKIYLTQKGIPRSLSEAGVLRFARQYKATRLRETADVEIEERQWRASLVASFNAPVRDSEFEVLFYDIQTAERKFIAPAMTVFVSDSNQRTIVHKLRLKRPQFEPNRRLEMVVTVRRKEVGRYRFQILGDAVQHSGEVTFTDDETR